MFEALVAFLLGLAFLTAVGHGLWLLCAKVIRAISGEGEHGSPSAASSKAKLRDQCPVCTTQFVTPSAHCEVCGWPERSPAPAARKRIALDALRRIALRFRRTEWLDVGSFQAITRAVDESLSPIASVGETPAPVATAPPTPAPVPMDSPKVEAAPVVAAVDAPVELEEETVLELVDEVPADDVAAASTPVAQSTYEVAAESSRRAERYVAARAAAPAVDAPPPVPHKPFAKILGSFLEEKNIRWGELIGGLLIICSSIALVLSFWQPISARPLLKFGLFNGVTAALFGIGLYVERRWRLPTTTHGILLIAVLLVPLNFLAIAAFTLDNVPTSAIAIGGELLSIALFAGLTYAAGRILVGPAGLALAAGVVGSSALELLVRRFTTATSSTEMLLAIGLPPVLCFAIPTATWARRLDRETKDTTFGEAETNRLFKITGTTLFAALLALGILLAKSGQVMPTLARVAPLISLLGAPLLAVGLVLWRRLTTPELMKERVAGTTIAVAGAMAMIAAVALGWPMPAGMLPTALINAAVFTWVALRSGIPSAHLPAALCLAAAYLLGFHVSRGGLAWHGADPQATFAVLLSAISGTALVVPAFFFALPAVLLGRTNKEGIASREFAKWYALAGGLTALVSAALVAYYAFGVKNDDAYATWVFALYAVGAIAAAAATGRKGLGYLGSGLAWAALVQGICFRYIGELNHAEAWTYAVLAHATISLAVMRLIAAKSPKMDGAVTPLFIGAAITSALAVPSLCCLAFWGQTLPAAIGLAWLAGVWGFIAWWVASPTSFTWFQAAGYAAAIEWSHFALTKQSWFDEIQGYPRIVDPRALAVYGLAAAALCGVWTAARLWLRSTGSVRVANGSAVTLDRFVLGGLVALIAALSLFAVVPGVCQEISPHGTVMSQQFGIGHTHARGPYVWALTSVVAAVIVLGLWESFARRKLLALVVVSVAGLLLVAARWEVEVATASALRWGSVLTFIVLSLPLWFRKQSVAVIDRLGWPGWRERGPSLAQFWFGWSLALSLAAGGIAMFRLVSLVFGQMQMKFGAHLSLIAVFVFAAVMMAIASIVEAAPAAGARLATSSWSQLGGRMFKLSGLILVAAIVLFDVATALTTSPAIPIVGPDATSFFAEIGIVRSYTVPILMLAGALLLHAFAARSAMLAFSASLVLNLGATIGYLLMLAPSGLTFDGELWLRIAHLNAATSALFGIAWIVLVLVRRKSAEVVEPTPSWLTTQVALAAALFAPAILGPIVQLFLDVYDPTSVPDVVADAWAWGSYATVLAAVVVWFRVERRPISVAAWSLSALGVVSLDALSRISRVVPSQAADDLVTLDRLVGAWMLVAFGLAICGYVAERRGWAFGPARGVVRWSTFIGLMAFLAAQFGLGAILAHGIFRSTAVTPHDFLISVSFQFAALLIGLAAWGASRGRLYVAAITATYGVCCVWFDSLGERLFPGEFDNGEIVFLVLLISWALPTPLWLAIERLCIIRRLSDRRWGRLPVLSRTTGFTSLIAITFFAIGGLTLDLNDESYGVVGRLYGAAMVSVLVAVATSLWDAGAKRSVAMLYFAGLTTIGVALDAFDLDSRMLFFTGTMFTSAYTLATSYLWSRRAGLLQFAAALRMPTEKWHRHDDATAVEEPLDGRRWLVAANYTLALLVVAAAYRVILTFEFWGHRFSAAQAVFGVAAAVALLAQGARRSSLQLRALELGWLGAIAVAWAVIEPGETFAFLDRAVLAVTATSLVVALYGLGFSKLLRAENDWTAAAQRLVPRLIVPAGIGLAVILAAEVFEFVEYGVVEIDMPAIIAVIVALVGLMGASITAALVPGRDPLGLSERGRMRYVYGAEIILALLLLHVRLTMPWLFGGYFLRYWPIVVMALAFAGVGLAEVFRRRNTNVLAEPLERTGAFLPLLPVFGYWATNSEVHYSLLLLAVGLLYSTLAVMRKSFGFGILAALAANGGLWYFLGTQEGLGWLEHPQIWLIPPALCVLIAAHLNRSRLTEEQSTAYRYGAAATIYVASTADVFLNGVAEAPMLPLWLAGLSIAGIFTGIALRIRAFLFLGTSFLLLALMTIIWHAAYDLEQTWIFYVSGIVAGTLIIALFAVFEKKRGEILGIVEKLRDWDA